MKRQHDQHIKCFHAHKQHDAHVNDWWWSDVVPIPCDSCPIKDCHDKGNPEMFCPF